MTTLKILYVEDEPDIRSIGMMALEMVGNYVVKACESGMEALEAAPVFRPQLIILDVMMPGMTGQETLEKLRKLPATSATPVIFMTAKVQAAEIKEYLDLGALGVIIKPFDPITVSSQVQEMWEKGNLSAA